MKKVFSLLLVAVLLFTLSFSCFAASSAVLSFSKDVVLSFVSSFISSYSNSIQQRTEAARGYYFYCILNDDISGGLPIFDSSGTKFSDDILNFYFNRYLEALNGTDIYDSGGDIFIQASGFPNTKFSLRLLDFGYPTNLLTGDDDELLLSTLKSSFKNYYNSLLARYLLAQGETATDPNPGKSGLDIAPGYVTSEDFKSSLSEDSSKYSVKNSAGKISYRNDKYYQTGLWQRVYSPTFFFAGEFNSVSSPDGFYCVPFFTDGTTRYIGEYQMHFYFSTEYDYTNKTAVKYLCLDLFKLADGSASEPELRFKSTSDFDDFSYFYLIPVNSASPWWKFYGFSSLTDFYSNKNYTLLTLANISNSYFKLISPDFSQTLDFYNVWNSSTYYFIQDYETHNKNCSLENDDIGFITSSSPLSTTYNFDINKISDGQLVTVTGGDTIYNYTILNPETGDSSKFGDYITNNYTYITNVNGGEGSGGSGVGGSVTVGGEIEVGGSVGLDINVNVPDININVNGNGSGAGGSGSISNPDDFTSAENVDLTKYYDSAVEQSTGFQKFLKDFFGFLPAELLGLILFAVAMAIVCRVFGR